MVEIIFQNKEDAKKLYDYMQKQFHSSNLPIKNDLLLEDKNKVKVKIGSRLHSLKIVKATFQQFILEIKQNDWFRRILKENYYFEDYDEQQQIIEIIHSILEGNRIDLASFIQDIDQEHQLEQSIEDMFMEQVSFSFDSFVRFRLRPFMDQLVKYVELAIDEYKMEQEYQMFIQTLRDFLINRPAKLNHLHLLIGDGVTFFDEHYYEIKRAELIRMIDRKLISNHPVYVDSVTIAPLLSIAPLNIFLYTDEPDQPLVKTIRNIFEERVIIKPLTSFYDSKRLFPYSVDEKI